MFSCLLASFASFFLSSFFSVLIPTCYPSSYCLVRAAAICFSSASPCSYYQGMSFAFCLISELCLFGLFYIFSWFWFPSFVGVFVVPTAVTNFSDFLWRNFQLERGRPVFFFRHHTSNNSPRTLPTGVGHPVGMPPEKKRSGRIHHIKEKWSAWLGSPVHIYEYHWE